VISLFGRGVTYHAATFIFLLVALGLYAIGLASDAQGVAAIGVCFEGIFWTRIFRKRPMVASIPDSRIQQ